MGRQWKTGMPGGVSSAIQGIANMGSMMKSIGPNIPSVSQFHCDACGALVQDSLWSKHQMFHQELARTISMISGSIGMTMSPLIELRQAVAEIDEDIEKLKAKKDTKVVPRPRKREEVGYVKPRRSANPQFTISVEIPSVAGNGDIFVYDAMSNKMIAVSGPQQQPPSMPFSPKPTEPQCSICGKYGVHMNDYVTRGIVRGNLGLFDSCKDCYSKHQMPDEF